MPESNLANPEESTGLTQESLDEARQGDPRTAKPAEAKPEAKESESETETDDKDEAAEEGQSADTAETQESDEAEESTEGSEDRPKPKMGLWDKERQARDQEQANERKALLAEVADLKKQVAAAAAAAEKKADKPSATAADADKSEALADIERQALELADSIDGDADAAAIGKAVKGALAKLFAAVKTVKNEHGDSADVRALKTKLDSIETALTESKAADAEAKKAEAERRALESQDAHIEGLDKKYGARFHNAAIKEARRMMEEDGFSDAKRPSLAYSKRVLDSAYATVAGKHVKAPAENKGARSDSITGGKSPNTTFIKPGSLADVKRQILASKRK
jgi:hypothetical protein